ncbi:MAG: CRTAC1 family protein [Acidobacteriota bacterium]
MSPESDDDPSGPPGDGAGETVGGAPEPEAPRRVEDSGDDEVIAVALRRSLAIFAAAAALGLLAWWAAGRGDGPAPAVALVAPAPQKVAAAGGGAPPALPFTDVTAESGIDFVHRNGARGEKLLPETMGGGVVAFDADGDGATDLLFVSSAEWPGAAASGEPSLGLFVNRGDGTFEDRTAAAGLDLALYGMGAAVGDYDGDGDPDLYLTALGENVLLRNDAGRFVDVTAEAGVGGAADAWSTAAAFVDIDGDLDLDLFVCHYVVWSPEIDEQLDFRLDGVGKAYGPPQNYRGTAPDLFRNDGGTFVDISRESGVRVLGDTGEPAAKALAVVPTDIDGDGLVDLLVANDTVRNFFFHNRGEGRFEEVGELYGLAYDRNGNATGAMGMDAAHHRNDHNLAFAVGNFANEMSSIYVAQDDPTFFVDEAIAEGLGAPSRLQLTFGLFFFDADLDGRQDLLQINGHIEERISAVDSSQSFEQPGQLFWNSGEGGLVALEAVGDLARPMAGRGAAYLDADGDGDLDVAVAQNAGAAVLLRNDQATGNRWLGLRLVAPAPNTAAVGAWIEVETAGMAAQRLEVRPTRSYLAQVSTDVTVGLGPHDAAERVQIRWPDGVVSEHADLRAGTLHIVRHPDLK